jgi:hypothetical protein
LDFITGSKLSGLREDDGKEQETNRLTVSSVALEIIVLVDQSGSQVENLCYFLNNIL